MIDPIRRASWLHILELVAWVSVGVGIAVVLASVLGLAVWATPALDDFCKASLSYLGETQGDAWTVTRLYFSGWSARWATIFLQSELLSNVDLITDYKWVLIGVILWQLGALYAFFRTVMEFGRGASIYSAALFFVGWAINLDSPGENLYWATGVTEYQISLGAGLLLIVLLARPRGPAGMLLVVGASLIIPGLHEAAGLCMLAITLVASAILKVHGRRVGLWGISFGLLAVGMGIVALSSGNGARALAEGRILWDWGSLPHALARTAWHGGNWVAQGSGLLIALGVNLSAPEPRRSIFPEWVSRKVALGLAAASLALVLGVDAVVMVAAGASPPLRLEAWFYWEFALSLTFLIGVLDAEFDLLPSAMSARATTLRTSALMLLAFHLVTAAGFERAIRDLGGPAQAWSRLASDSLILNEDPRDVRAVLQATPSEYLSPGIGEATPWVDTCWQNFVRGRKTEFEEGH